MNKVIHYCWFGGKPLPKLAKQCIKSWKKYLPDYEIKEWNEKNFDINICPFVKEAYENKKWAFVSDYARIYALYQYGGIYFDTDMKIIKDPTFVLDKDLFMGYEDSGYFGTAVIGVKEKNNKYIKEILDFYDKQEHFYVNNISNYANPIVITNIFHKHPLVIDEKGIEIIDNSIHIYPRDYFYPLSYNYSEKNYSENTCMVHYFSATWTDKYERRAIGLYRTFGMTFGNLILNVMSRLSNRKYRIVAWFKSKIYNMKMRYSIYMNRNKRIKKIDKMLKEQKSNYVAIYHPDWLGVTNSTKDIFEYTIPLRDQHTVKEAQGMAKAIVENGKKLVIFSGFTYGWDYIAKEIKKLNRNIEIRIILHGGNALLTEGHDWDMFNLMLQLYDNKVIDELVFVKKSLYEFYKKKGYNCSFLMNNITIKDKEKYISDDKNNQTKIGFYASGDRWVKNTYNQISAISLIPNVELDCVPINYKISTIAKRYRINLMGEEKNISREELYKRMAKNDINLYATFTECAPLIPLESLELGVPCITGNNHHYFENTELEKYLVVEKADNIMEIYEKINLCLENREKILELYKKWKADYDILVKENQKKFLGEINEKE